MTIPLVFLPAVVLLLQPGCEDKRRHGANKGITVEDSSPSISPNAPPDEVAKALLAALGRAQDARSRGLGDPERRAAYEKAMADIMSLAAKSEIAGQMRKSGSANVAKDITDETALTLTAESWVSVVAHYVKGLLPDTLRVSPDGSQTTAEVRIAAESPEDKAELASLRPSDPAPTIPATTTQAADAASGAAIREAALRHGINPLLRAEITIRLKNLDGRWRATSVNLGPSGMTFLPTAPKPMAAPSTQSSKS